MARADEDGGGGKRAEWVEGLAGKEKTLAWIWWRRPEEWAALIAGWVSACFLLLLHFSWWLSFMIDDFVTNQPGLDLVG